MTKNIGFIGLGAMGSAMAPHLVEAGYQLIGFDINARIFSSEKFYQAKSLDELIIADVVILMGLIHHIYHRTENIGDLNEIVKKIVRLPMHNRLTIKEVDFISNTIKKYFNTN